MLNRAGIATAEGHNYSSPKGYPVVVRLSDGGSLVLDLPFPGFLSQLSEEHVGVVVLDPLGYPASVWGFAKEIPYFQAGRSVLETPIAGLMEGSFEGNHGALYLDGVRYFPSHVETFGRPEVMVLVINASEERHYRSKADKSARTANALKRLGKTLTITQSRQPLCVAATHEIASVMELAAVLLWVYDADSDTIELCASVGANRQGSGELIRLNASEGAGCAAELVASSRQRFTVSDVHGHLLTREIEGKLCYLRPGGATVHPLQIGDRLIGVLEMVGREGDAVFDDSADLFETVAEHLTLAINSAAMFEDFERLASNDALTGLRNHRYMQDFLHRRVMEAERGGRKISVMMLDVDHFHSFNEEEGHDAGDEVLKLVAEVLHSITRAYDMAARYGGEEFVVAMPEIDIGEAARIGERVRKRVEAKPYITKSGREAHVTLSIGVACYPDSATDAASLLKAADIALFEAKRGGRNQVVKFTGENLTGQRPPLLNLEALAEWMTEDEWVQAIARVQRLGNEFEAISGRLSLSHSQRTILQALLLISPRYSRAVVECDIETLEGMESDGTFRLLLPSLRRMHDRYDGKGVRSLGGNNIPLLARVLQVLIAIESDPDAFGDSGRFDPHIVSVASSLHSAA
ncbi:MAG TPA: GGDEF domain-containing protein [Fimbriimonas sp.]|nr:GGDEF domain-containing protein [Fimbriimonas sp.]